jgi:hypothetical protein
MQIQHKSTSSHCNENMAHKNVKTTKGNTAMQPKAMKMAVPATIYVERRKRSMWELAKSMFKIGAGECLAS